MKLDKSQKQLIAVIGVIVIVGSVLTAGFTGLIDIGLMGITDTQNKIVNGVSGQWYFTEIENKKILQGGHDGLGEMTKQERYLSTWIRNGEGEKIIISGKLDLYSAWYYWLTLSHPGVLIGRYWYEGWFTDQSGTRKVIWAGGSDSNYVEVTWDSPTHQQPQYGHFDKKPFQNIEADYTTEYSKYLKAPDGWNKWFADDRDGYGFARTLYAYPVAFFIKNGRQGTFKIQLKLEYSQFEQNSQAPTEFRYRYKTAVLQEDQFYIDSGEGDLDITDYNMVRIEGATYADGTNEYYTKYVFEEGSKARLNIDTGSSKPEEGKPWRVEVIKPDDTVFQTFSSPFITDEKDNQIVEFTIPDGSFVPGGTNEWKVKLINPALDFGKDPTAQAEIKLFVVDTFQHVPSATKIYTSGATFSEGQSVVVTCEAYANPKTEDAITQFRLWGRLNHPRTGPYIFDGYITRDRITVSGQKYTGEISIELDRQGTIYFMAFAQDEGGYTGGEGTATISVTSAPTYEVVVTVTDKNTNEPIQFAKVTFGTTQKPTRSDGSATFDLQTGRYPFYVEATDYKYYSGGTIEVGRNMELTAELEPITVVEPDDWDGDGILNDQDNCPYTSNPDQLDSDNDGTGDVCDDTPFGEDGETQELTVEVFSTGGEIITDATVTIDGDSKDTVNGVAEFILTYADYTITTTATGYISGEEPITIPRDSDYLWVYLEEAEVTDIDGDGDGILDDVDNCPDTYNPDQLDSDNDGIGDFCDDTPFPPEEEYYLTVQVSSNGMAIENAFVQVDVQSRWTDSAGEAYFTFDAMGTYDYLVVAEGYEDDEGTVYVSGVDTLPISLTVREYEPDPIIPDPVVGGYDVTIKVTNEIKAMVRIDDDRKFTAEDGIAVFNLTAGTKTLVVGASGYETQTQTITIPDQVYYEVTLGITPEEAEERKIPGFEIPLVFMTIFIFIGIAYLKKKRENEK